MAHPENNEKNRFELAENIVDTWSLEDLKGYVIHKLEDDYRADSSYFEEEFDCFKTSFEWSEELRESMKKDCPNPGCYCGACEKKDDESWKLDEAFEGRR